VTPKEWKGDYVIVPEVMKTGSPTEVQALFVIEFGKPGVAKA
jgi:hypothetical protein